MTPSQQAKAYGCKSLVEVGRVSGTSPRTLSDWHTTRPLLFKAVCLGSVSRDQGWQAIPRHNIGETMTINGDKYIIRQAGVSQ